MAKLSNAEIALLGLLSEQPMHPYLIEQQVQYRDMRSWTDLSMSSIYKLLRKLEKLGLIDRNDQISDENRLQKVYALNAAGRSALQESVEEILSNPEHTQWRIDIGIYNCDILSPKQVERALIKYRSGLVKKKGEYEELLEFLRHSECPDHRLEVAKRPIFLLEAEIGWVDAYFDRLQEKSYAG